jgi:hypothetical protein
MKAIRKLRQKTQILNHIEAIDVRFVPFVVDEQCSQTGLASCQTFCVQVFAYLPEVM